MNRLIRVLRDRRGESMVEILVSTVVFMLLLGALNGAVGFASNAQRKSEQLRRDATELQESVRGNAEVADGEADAYNFKVTTSNGEDTDIDAFRVKVKKQTVNAKTEDGKTVPFYRFVVGAGLLCLVIGIFSASLRPAAEVSRRTQELNSAELIADDLLETVRSKVETATDYIKCYDSGTDVTNKTGSSEGSAIEFGYETEQRYNAAELLTADGCGPTKIVIADKDSGEQPRVEKGYLVERYYKDGYSQDADGNPIARAMTKTYAEGFYMGLRAGLHFKIDEAKHTVTATVTIYRDKDLTDKIYSDSLIIDLRYDIPVKTEVTATKKPA